MRAVLGLAEEGEPYTSLRSFLRSTINALSIIAKSSSSTSSRSASKSLTEGEIVEEEEGEGEEVGGRVEAVEWTVVEAAEGAVVEAKVEAEVAEGAEGAAGRGGGCLAEVDAICG